MLVALLVLVVMNRREPLAPWLGGVFAALLLWTIAYIFELVSGSQAAKIAWADPQFIGATVMALLWFYAMRRAVAARSMPTWLSSLLCLLCVAIVVCVFVNPGHLFRGQPALDRSGPITFLDADYGPLYYGLWMPFVYGLLLAALVMLARAALGGPELVRARSRLLIAATLLPMLVGVLFIAGALPWPNFNPAISSLSISAVLCAVALLRYRLLDVTPLARETVIEQLADPIVVIDARGLLCDFNPAAGRVLPELSREALGRPLLGVLAGRPELIQSLQRARRAREETAPGEAGCGAGEDERTLALSVDGATTGARPRVCYFSLGVTPVVRSTGLQIGEAIVLHDVTRSSRLYDEARRLASTDELTGLLSRRRVLELGLSEVERARRQCGGIGVLLLDVDHFKLVNDRYGHAAGDAVLRAVGRCCRSELRDFDLLGRYGGDEFCAILPELKLSGAVAAAERLRMAVADLSVCYEDRVIHATVSIGVIAAAVEGETTLDQLMRMADEALYEAKLAGRDRVAAAESIAESAAGAVRDGAQCR